MKKYYICVGIISNDCVEVPKVTYYIIKGVSYFIIVGLILTLIGALIN